MTFGRILLCCRDPYNINNIVNVAGGFGNRSGSTNWTYTQLAPGIAQAYLGSNKLELLIPRGTNNSVYSPSLRLGNRIMLTGIDLRCEYNPLYMIMSRQTTIGGGFFKRANWVMPFKMRCWLYWCPLQQDGVDTTSINFIDLLNYQSSNFGAAPLPNSYGNATKLQNLPFYLGAKHHREVPETGGSDVQKWLTGGLDKAIPKQSLQLISHWIWNFKKMPRKGHFGADDDADFMYLEYTNNTVTQDDVARINLNGTHLESATLVCPTGESLATQHFTKRLKLNKIIDFSHQPFAPEGAMTEQSPGQFVLAYTTTINCCEGTSNVDAMHSYANKIGFIMTPRFYWYDLP